MKLATTAFLCLLILCFSCGKDDVKGPCQLKEAKYTYPAAPGETQLFDYDASGRVKKINGSSVTTFEYFTDSVVIILDNMRTTYFLNSAKRADSSRSVNVVGGIPGFGIKSKYSYDADGGLTQEMQIFSQLYMGNMLHDTSYFNYTWQNGNVIKATSTQWSYEEHYEYNDRLRPANNPAIDYFPAARGSYLGKTTKNMLSKIKTEAGMTVATITYSYDALGNVTKRTAVQASTTPAATTTTTEFRYKCN